MAIEQPQKRTYQIIVKCTASEKRVWADTIGRQRVSAFVRAALNAACECSRDGDWNLAAFGFQLRKRRP